MDYLFEALNRTEAVSNTNEPEMSVVDKVNGMEAHDSSMSIDEENDSVNQPNPWHRDYTAKMCGLHAPSIRDRVYTFLLSSSLNELRKMCRETRAKQAGVKNAVICHLLIKGKTVVSDGTVEWNEFFNGRLGKFWSNPAKISTPIRFAPSDNDIVAFAAESTERVKRTAAIATHEFARLVGILIDNEEARTGLLQSGIDLTRVEQQRRSDRDEFWETTVARLHNNPNIVVRANFTGLVDADEHQTLLNPNISVPQRRSGAWLKGRFFSVRTIFTRAFHNWTRSGQNSPEGHNFSDFVPRAPSSTAISSIGRFCLILFYAMKWGTENEDTEVLNFTSKLAPLGLGYDDGADETTHTPGGGDSRKRKQIFDEIVRESKVRNKNISELVGAVQTMISNKSSKSTENQVIGTSLTSEVFTLTKQLNELRKLDHDIALTR